MPHRFYLIPVAGLLVTADAPPQGGLGAAPRSR
jgi:hypothetical protein